MNEASLRQLLFAFVYVCGGGIKMRQVRVSHTVLCLVSALNLGFKQSYVSAILEISREVGHIHHSLKDMVPSHLGGTIPIAA